MVNGGGQQLTTPSNTTTNRKHFKKTVMVQSWKVFNAQDEQINTFYCSTIEQAKAKLELKYGAASCFAYIQKGKRVNLSDIPLKNS